jgi:hypothetical protein
MMENRSLNGTYGIIQSRFARTNAPYIGTLISQNGLAAEFYDNGVVCGSINSYIAITNGNSFSLSGSNCGQCNGGPSGSCIVNTVNLPDRLEKIGMTWKSYFEDMPSPCSLASYPSGIGDYDVGHNPFIFYSDIQNNSTRCQNHVVPAGDRDSCPGTATSLGDIQNCDKYLLNDLNSVNPPNYMWLGPNTWNNMYDHYPDGDSCTSPVKDSATYQAQCVQQTNTYLSYLIPAIKSTTAWNTGHTGIFLVWDEPGPSDLSSICPNPNPNAPSTDTCQIPGIWIGPMVKIGYVSHHMYSLYSFLATIENYWGLPPMTSNDANAVAMTEFFN